MTADALFPELRPHWHQYPVLDSVTIRVPGQLYSKANSRRVGVNPRTGKVMNIKKAEAIAWKNTAITLMRMQGKELDPHGMLVPLPKRLCYAVRVDIHYATWMSDLDESLVWDALQEARVFPNDSMIVVKYGEKWVSKHNPRVEICVELLDVMAGERFESDGLEVVKPKRKVKQ